MIKQSLLDGAYTPKPLRRVEIPKESGGVRILGIPTTCDKFIQNLLLEGLTPIFEPLFSENSYGFRPGRSQQQAIEQTLVYTQEKRWVVDIDISKCFDRVNHDILMALLAAQIDDKEILKTIRGLLESGIMINGVVIETREGTPQGGPLSPLLSNVLLNELDKELERRGHSFVRYADDVQIYVRSERAGERVMESICNFLEEELKLKINHDKSTVDRITSVTYLGFSFYLDKRDNIRLTISGKKEV